MICDAYCVCVHGLIGIKLDTDFYVFSAILIEVNGSLLLRRIPSMSIKLPHISAQFVLVALERTEEERLNESANLNNDNTLMRHNLNPYRDKASDRSMSMTSLNFLYNQK